MFDVLKAQRTGDRLMKKNSTVQAFKSEIFEEQKLTIGLPLGAGSTGKRAQVPERRCWKYIQSSKTLCTPI
jgi:hypothetical protein